MRTRSETATGPTGEHVMPFDAGGNSLLGGVMFFPATMSRRTCSMEALVWEVVPDQGDFGPGG